MAIPVAAAIAGVGVVTAAVRRNAPVLAVALVGIGLVSGGLAEARIQGTLHASVPQGRGELVGAATTDAVPSGEGSTFILRPSSWRPAGTTTATPWAGPALLVVAKDGSVTAGDVVAVAGLVRPIPGMTRGDPVAGRVTAATITPIGVVPPLVVEAGNAIRARVQTRLATLGQTPEAALLGGFLIGDVADLPEIDTESLRRAGLTHYVAVSGSNVALVLGAWWLVLGTTGAGTRIRAVTGLVVLVIFVVVTRWESSVIRAATMAGLVMGGRAGGVAIDAWTALGAAAAILLTVSGDLASDVGFQLSVAATAGVLAGMHIWAGRTPKLFWGVLAATISAQLAVVPLLLVHFGTVPLLAPAANLLAAPLVTGATALAGIGVIVSWDPPLRIAAALAELVLQLARRAAAWPQLGAGGVAWLLIPIGLAWRTRLRGIVVVVALAMVMVSALPPGPPDVPTVIWLDVGQGDAVLLRDPSGTVALMDGGREPLVLRDALRRHGIDRIDLVVASHGDADHIGGLPDLFEYAEVGHLWVPAFVEPRELLSELIAAAESHGVAVDAVAAGGTATFGQFVLDVVGPQRRFAEENDGSVVLLVQAAGKTVLLPGDIGVIAQRSLPALHPDLLMVPHHGAATSDVDWIAATVGSVAIISVGPNTYGHPDPEVLSTLADKEVRVLTTWDEGDIAVPLRDG